MPKLVELKYNYNNIKICYSVSCGNTIVRWINNLVIVLPNENLSGRF